MVAGNRHIDATIREQITDSQQLDFGIILKVEFNTESGPTMANNSNANLAVGLELPDLRFVDVGFRLFKSGNDLGPFQTDNGRGGKVSCCRSC